MSPVARVAFGLLAIVALSGVAYFSFRSDASEIKPIFEASPLPELAAAPPSTASTQSRPTSLPALPSYKTDAEIPYDKLTLVAHVENRVIYTTSSLGEPMEVHPDGLVVIYNHRKVLRYADGREEVRYVTLRARPRLVSAIDEEVAPTITTR